MEITNDDSDLMTEQSSSSDFLANEKGEKEIEDSSEIESLESAENLEYTELKIEDPPSFLNSQYEGPPHLAKKSYSKRFLGLKNDEDVDDVFQKKSEPKQRGLRIGQKISSASEDRAASSSGSRNNRKTRRDRKTNAKKNVHSFFDWKFKREDETKGETNGKAGIFRGAGEDYRRGNEEEDTSDSPASVSTINSDDTRGRKPFRHLTIALDDEKTPVQKEVKHEELYIAGIKVKFPVKPYSSQIAVMNKLIQGCKKGEHCLLESPTGSGKTLALLCGVLAWQEHTKDEIRQKDADAAQKVREHLETVYGIEDEGAAMVSVPTAEGRKDEPPECCAANECRKVDEFRELSEDDCHQPASKKICRSTSPESACQAETSNFDYPDVDEFKFLNEEETKRERLPKIFYGSRTHKQIEQVIRELKKTAYSYKTMTILSSREFTCIQETNGNKTEECAKRLDPVAGHGCRYYHENTRSRISTNRALNGLGIRGPWDIEDLVVVGREQSACPYFAARDLMLEAEIVFCPYNYLVDPNIRQSMQIQLEGHIVILDEAHNIEEMSREVGSLSFREDKITEVVEEVSVLSHQRKLDQNTYNTIKWYLNNFVEFLKVNKLNKVDKFKDTSSSDFWTGVQLCELFNIHHLGKGNAKNFQAAAGAAILDYNAAKEEMAQNKKQEGSKPSPVITPIAKKFLEDLILALDRMTSEKLADDYRACIIESEVRDFGRVSDNTWVPRGQSTKRLRTLQMLCMNPAVIFAPLADMARSVVLASGTLSPITSFQSELGTVFPHKLDANHVVPKESVYIRGIPCGPTGVQLKANYTNVNSWNFQDELGRLILTVCRVIPHGVLCFFSSYSMMQKQIDRWKQNSCWQQLEEVKCVLQEPRGSANLEPVMQEFRNVVHSTSDHPSDGITGALLLAVFRGKVAEGIDFSDNEARCVMAIGIPYAIRKDPSVDMKFTYNNLNQSRGLLKGGEWYAVQAFRALNQALGRCVRHRNDWGAVLLIDQRFLERSNYNYLPKWVKTMWRDSARFNLTQELEQFVASQVERTKKEKLDSAGL